MNLGEIRHNPEFVRDLWENAKCQEPPGESETVGNYA